MWLRHVYFHRTLQYHVVNCICILHHFMKLEDIARSAYVKTLAYTTGTTSKHQRATWPELYPKSILFIRIVAWHMRVFSHLHNVWGYGAGPNTVCWWPNLTPTKRVLFCISFPESYPFNRNLPFLSIKKVSFYIIFWKHILRLSP